VIAGRQCRKSSLVAGNLETSTTGLLEVVLAFGTVFRHCCLDLGLEAAIIPLPKIGPKALVLLLEEAEAVGTQTVAAGLDGI